MGLPPFRFFAWIHFDFNKVSACRPYISAKPITQQSSCQMVVVTPFSDGLKSASADRDSFVLYRYIFSQPQGFLFFGGAPNRSLTASFPPLLVLSACGDAPSDVSPISRQPPPSADLLLRLPCLDGDRDNHRLAVRPTEISLGVLHSNPRLPENQSLCRRMLERYILLFRDDELDQ
jgi:hypothetical protein